MVPRSRSPSPSRAITEGWEEAGHTVEERLGPKDVILTPAGRVHYFRNDGVADADYCQGIAKIDPYWVSDCS